MSAVGWVEHFCETQHENYSECDHANEENNPGITN